jgi:tetratricopeptide (TPR) repeat protein
MNKALEGARAANNHNAIAMAHCALAFTRLIAGDYPGGMESARSLHENSERSGADIFRYGALSMLAWGAFRLGQPNESRRYWDEAHDLAKALGGRVFFAEWFAAVEAEFVVKAGDAVEGLRKAEEALSLSRNAGSVIGEALSECTIGEALGTISERRDEAYSHLAKGRGMLEEIGAEYDLARALLTEAQVHSACGDFTGAKPIFERAITRLHDYQLEHEESIARALMNELQKKTG